MEQQKKIEYRIHPYGCTTVYDLNLAFNLIDEIYGMLIKSVHMYGCYPIVMYDALDIVFITPDQLEVYYLDQGHTLTGIKLKYHLGFWEVITRPGNIDTKLQEMYVQYGRATKGRYPDPTGQILK